MGCSVENNVIFHGLPSAGISDADMQDMQRFGCRLVEVLNENRPLDKSLFQKHGCRQNR